MVKELKSRAALLLRFKLFLQRPLEVFIAVALIFGTAMSFCLPLFQAPDEPVHFYRAYQVGEGHFISQTVNGKTGGEVRKVIESQPGEIVENMPETFVEFPSSALYSPVSYLPQAIGIDMGRLMGSTVETMAHTGRLFNLLAYIFLVSLAIKIAKRGKWVYVVAGLFPMAIQQAASLSTDVMTIGLTFITIALLHGLFLQKKILSKKQWGLVILLAVLLGLTKQTNIIFLLPVIFLPKSLFVSLRKKIIFVALVIGASLLSIAGWYAMIKLNHYSTELSSAIIGQEGVNNAEQIKYVLTHPIEFTQTLYRTFVFEGFGGGVPTADFYWVSMFGFFAGFIYKMPIMLILLGYALLLLALLEKRPEAIDKKILKNQTFIQTSVFFIALIGIATALYVVWTPVGAAQIAGIQGRYFIPLIPLLIPLFQYISRSVGVMFDKPYKLGLLTLTISIINLSAMLFLTYKWFYV